MALENWDWFIKLAETENFTKAAESLQISQQTLSARLVALEKTLEAKLIVRGTPLSLTSAGMVFLIFAREQRQASRDMLRQIGEVTGGGAGILKVGISHVRGRLLMPQAIRRMHAVLPGVSIHLVEGTNRELIRMAEHAEVDAVIARLGMSIPGVEVTPLYEEEVVLAIRGDLLESIVAMPAKECAVRLSNEGIGKLKECPFVLESIDDIAGRIAYSELRNAGIDPKVVATSENLPTLLAMAAEGLGAVFCPVNMFDVLHDSLTKDLVRITLSEQAKYDISLGIPLQREEWKALESFKDLIRDQTSLINAKKETAAFIR